MSKRRDALVAAAAHVQAAVQQISQIGGPEARITFGMLDIRPSATNVIPGEATLRQEIRHPVSGKLDLLKEWAAELALSVAERWHCKLTVVEQGGKPPVEMNACIRRAITEAAAELGLPTMTLPSGAGHDAQVLGARLRSGMIFVPSSGGRSHCPDEYTEPALIENGANVLLRTLARLIAQRHELPSKDAGSR
jgi:N-carbamoyl-L-amino-acid hydrolase